MYDRKALRALSSGLYIVSAKAQNRSYGCVVNTLVQVASEPPTLSVSVNKENATAKAIIESGRFAAVALAEDAPLMLIGTFGFHSSLEMDKFEPYEHRIDSADVPYVTEHALARFSVRLTETIDVGSHYLFVGVVEEAEVISTGNPLTYALYHAVKGGKTPPRAATYNGGDDDASSTGVVGAGAGAGMAATSDASAVSGVGTGVGAAGAGTGMAAVSDASAVSGVGVAAGANGAEGSVAVIADAETGKPVAWRCLVCGYIEEGYPEGLPSDYLCPICSAPADQFERV